MRAFTPPPPPPFVCKDGTIIAIAPWSYSMAGGPFRSAIEVSKDGDLLFSIDVNVSRAEIRNAHDLQEVMDLMLSRVNDALLEVYRRLRQMRP